MTSLMRPVILVLLMSCAMAAGSQPLSESDLHIVNYAAAEALAEAQAPKAAEADRLATETLEISLVLNSRKYEKGEPIIATCTVKNMGAETISFGVPSGPAANGQWKGWARNDMGPDFEFTARHDNGSAASDPLKTFQGYSIKALSGGVSLKPGESWIVSSLVNLYCDPRMPGQWTLEGKYRDKQRASFDLPAVQFEILDQNTMLPDSHLKKLSEQFFLLGIDPSLMSGLRGDKAELPKLAAMALDPQPQQESNAKIFAAESLILFPNKSLLFETLNATLADRSPNFDDFDSFARMVYGSAALPEALPTLEKGMNHPHPAVRSLALQAALSLGSEQALERLDDVVLHGSAGEKDFALQAAFRYLFRADGIKWARVENLDASRAPAYHAMLLDLFRQESEAAPPPNSPSDFWPYNYLYWFAITPQRFDEAMRLAMNSPSPKLNMAALRWLASAAFRSNTPMDELQTEALTFARAQLATRTQPMELALAARALAALGDTQSIPAIRAFFMQSDQDLRRAAAWSLVILGDMEHLEQAIEVCLANDQLNRFPNDFHLLAGKLGWIDVHDSAGILFLNLAATQPPKSDRFLTIIETWRKEVLYLLARRHAGQSMEPLSGANAPSKNSGICPGSNFHTWNPTGLLGYLTFCPYCEAPLF